MPRDSWFEVHDHPLFPSLPRHLVTNALEALWNATDLYQPIMPRLKRALDKTGTRVVVDLCSGGGGPWFRLQPALSSAGSHVSVRLTDKCPNHSALERVSVRFRQAITGYPKRVDANCPPQGLTGFRTMFSSFHHFDPEEARAILADSFDCGEGIAIFEAAERRPQSTFAISFFVPLLALVLTPTIRPSSMVTFLLDLSDPCYSICPMDRRHPFSPKELFASGPGGACSRPGFGKYSWHVRQDGEGIFRITYLVGSPAQSSEED